MNKDLDKIFSDDNNKINDSIASDLTHKINNKIKNRVLSKITLLLLVAIVGAAIFSYFITSFVF